MWGFSRPTRPRICNKVAPVMKVELGLLPSHSRVEAASDAVFENLPVCTQRLGPDGTIVGANRAQLELLGYRRDEYVGCAFAQFLLDSKAIEKLLAGESLRDFPARLRCKDG